MSKAIVGLVAVAAVGGIAFAVSKANASPGASSGPFPSAQINVTGPSGTTYGIRLLDEESTGDGVVQHWEVADASGVVLEYTQFKGDDTSRILFLTPEAPHKPGDPMWLNAVQDFGIFTSVEGLELPAAG